MKKHLLLLAPAMMIQTAPKDLPRSQYHGTSLEDVLKPKDSVKTLNAETSRSLIKQRHSYFIGCQQSNKKDYQPKIQIQIESKKRALVRISEYKEKLKDQELMAARSKVIKEIAKSQPARRTLGDLANLVMMLQKSEAKKQMWQNSCGCQTKQSEDSREDQQFAVSVSNDNQSLVASCLACQKTVNGTRMCSSKIKRNKVETAKEEQPAAVAGAKKGWW